MDSALERICEQLCKKLLFILGPYVDQITRLSPNAAADSYEHGMGYGHDFGLEGIVSREQAVEVVNDRTELTITGLVCLVRATMLGTTRIQVCAQDLSHFLYELDTVHYAATVANVATNLKMLTTDAASYCSHSRGATLREASLILDKIEKRS